MIALTVVLCIAWMLPGLIGHDPWKPDEAYTFGLVHHILQTGDWVVPTLAGEPFLEKPPVFYLTAALTAKLFAAVLPLHDGARLAAGLYVGLAMLFVGLAGRTLFGPNRGWVSTLMMIGCLGLVVRAHQMITDTALLAGFAIALYGLARSLASPVAGGAWLGTGVGLGFMAKGLLAPGVLGLSCLALLAFAPWRTKRHAIALVVALLACLPWLTIWPAALHARSPQLFEEWLWINNLGRFAGSNNLGPKADPLHYFRILPWYALPAWLLACWVLWRERARVATSAGIQLGLVVFAILFAVLSISADARELYAMPLLPALALLATPAVDTLRRGAANLMYWFGVMGFSCFAAILWFYWMATEMGIPARLHGHMHTLQPGYEAGLRFWPFVIGAAYTIGWIALLTRLPRSQERPVVIWAAGVALLYGLLMTLFVQYLDTGKSYRPMIASLVRALPPKYDCISSRAIGEPQRALLQYHAGIITWREDVPGRKRDCDLLLWQGDTTIEPALPVGFTKIWEGARIGDNSERYRLYTKKPAPKPRARPAR